MSYYPDSLTHKKGPAWGADAMNEYAEADGATATIQGRVEAKFMRVLKENGEEHQAAFRIFTPADVRAGDVLTIDGQDHEVAVAGVNKDLTGFLTDRTVMC